MCLLLVIACDHDFLPDTNVPWKHLLLTADNEIHRESLHPCVRRLDAYREHQRFAVYTKQAHVHNRRSAREIAIHAIELSFLGPLRKRIRLSFFYAITCLAAGERLAREKQRNAVAVRNYLSAFTWARTLHAASMISDRLSALARRDATELPIMAASAMCSAYLAIGG